MQFRIADTFTDSLAKLTGDEQKAVKTTAFDLQMDPARPGLKLHQVEGAKDKGFWSARVSRDIRLIVHRTASSFLLCYVDHHDAAYQWAGRRRLERHPTTGAAQLVEIRETVREIPVPRYVEVDVPAAAHLVASGRPAAPRGAIFGGASDDYLLGYGVPAEWLGDVRAATEDTLLDLADHLPAEAGEALLQIATGGAPALPAAAAADADPFAHPDAQRRFRVMADVEALERALDYSWEKWTVFLHPAQRQLVEREYNGPRPPSRVSAGTGKTIVALPPRRASRPPPPREPRAAGDLLRRAGHGAPSAPHAPHRQRAEDRRAPRGARHGRHRPAALHGPRRSPRSRPRRGRPGPCSTAPRPASRATGSARTSSGPNGARWSTPGSSRAWEDYRDVPRLGRKTRLAEKQREVLWAIFSRVRSALAEDGRLTEPAMFTRLAAQMAEAAHPPFDFCVIDEAQDVGVAELRLLAALGGGRPNGLFFAGDLGQRIFQTPFSWRSLGVDVRGRSHTLRINYRTSHQIRRQADRLLPRRARRRRRQRRASGAPRSRWFNGPAPELRVFDSPQGETEAIAGWLRARQGRRLCAAGDRRVRSGRRPQIERALSAVRAAGMQPVQLDAGSGGVSGSVAVGTMHLAKGLEFRAVVVAACDDEVIPLQGRIEHVADEADLEEVYGTERHLLYVACTRARRPSAGDRRRAGLGVPR